MRFLLLTALTLLLAFVAHQWLPWYAVALAAALAAWLMKAPAPLSFLAGFLAAALLWGVSAGWINHGNEGLLAERVGRLFGGLSPAAMVGLSALLGGLTGGLGALTGSLARRH
jgi:hypothetical protein